MGRCNLAMFLAATLLANAFSLPADIHRQRGLSNSTSAGKELSSSDRIIETAKEIEASMATSSTSTTEIPIEREKSNADDDDDDDDDDFNDTKCASCSGGGGSNIFSLLNLANAFFPASGANGGTSINHKLIQAQMKKIIQESWARNQIRKMQGFQNKIAHSRKDIADNVIDIDYTADLKPPPFQRQESDEDDNSETYESSESEENNGGETSVEELDDGNGETNSKQDSASNASNGDNDSDYDEPPGGDGQGGGILGLLAGLSGDGDSDLGTLLATVGGIVANLSGDGIDLNALIATGLGLFVGLLSDGTENPGEVVASYLLTSLDTITGGGANNNGAFFGKFLSKLIKGTSAAGDPDDESDENGPKMADSAGFFASLLMGLLGEMSKTSSGGSSR